MAHRLGGLVQAAGGGTFGGLEGPETEPKRPGDGGKKQTMGNKQGFIMGLEWDNNGIRLGLDWNDHGE